MDEKYDVIVVGAGSAGLIVASGAANFGAKVLLIETDKMGGDCLNAGCVPSKTFLKSAHLAQTIRKSQQFGISAQLEPIDLAAIMADVQNIIAKIAPNDSKERYESLGVEVEKGTASFIDSKQIQVNERIVTAKKIVIATGAKPVVPPILGLDTVDFYTNETIFNLKQLPESLLIFGAGPIGLELGQGFAHLGTKVTIIDHSSQLFSKDDPEVGQLMKQVFAEQNITCQLDAKIIAVAQDESGRKIVTIERQGIQEVLSGETLLVSLGRKPDTDKLKIANAGVTLTPTGAIQTNSRLQTNVKHIYACGDVTGKFQFTHTAAYQASLVVRNALFGLRTKEDYRLITWTTFTQPEVAHVGETEQTARKKDIFSEAILVDLAVNDRSQTEREQVGFIKLIIGRNNQLLGTTIVAEKASEMLPLATLTIQKKLKATTFFEMMFAYPTQSELYKTAAIQLVKRNLKPNYKKLVQRIFFLKGDRND